jgi:putative ABC transport system permease protein
VPVRRVRTLDDLGDEATARPRFRAMAVAAFAVVALVLAAVGVFSVLAYAVEQRRREFGVRLALGASAGRLLTMVLRHAARVVAGGTVAGLALSLACTRLIAGFLHGVTPLDPLTFAGVIAILAALGIVATLAPALRATRVDPLVTFRAEQ